MKNIFNEIINFDFHHPDIFDLILNWTKFIETRANDKENYNKIKVWDNVTFTDKIRLKKYLVEIESVYIWKSLDKLLYDKSNLTKIYWKNIQNITRKDLEEFYSFSSDYLDRINKNWLIWFGFKIISEINY
jgi:hypothetical protein